MIRIVQSVSRPFSLTVVLNLWEQYAAEMIFGFSDTRDLGQHAHRLTHLQTLGKLFGMLLNIGVGQPQISSIDR